MSEQVLMNLFWVLLTALLGLALPVGIGLMACSTSGPKGPWLRGRLLLAALLAILISFACGFSLQYGAIHAPQLGEQTQEAWRPEPFGAGSGLLAWAGPGLPEPLVPGRMALFALQVVGTMTVVALALAPLRERLPNMGLLLVTLVIAGILYPLLGNWVWGGGWLSAVGRTAYLGHGLVDWAGAGVHYALGGLLALAGLIAGRARVERGAEAGPSLGSALLVVLGMTALHLAAPWEMLSRSALVVVNTWIGAAAAAVAAAAYMAFATGRLQPAMLARGLIAGAAASGALAPYAPPATLILVGAVAGLLVCLGSYLLEGVWKLDDRGGIVSSFGFGGLWGLLAVGLLANGSYGQGLYGIGSDRYLGVAGQGVSGIALLAQGMVPDWGQLAAQVLGLLVVVVLALGPGWLLFRLAYIRPREEGELYRARE